MSSVSFTQKLLSFDQIAVCNHKSRLEYYKLVDNVRVKTPWKCGNSVIRVASPLIAAGDLVVQVASSVARVAEMVLKGMANIVLFPFCKNARFSRGCIVLAFSAFEVICTSIALVCKVVRVPFTTLGLLFIPEHALVDIIKGEKENVKRFGHVSF